MSNQLSCLISPSLIISIHFNGFKGHLSAPSATVNGILMHWDIFDTKIPFVLDRFRWSGWWYTYPYEKSWSSSVGMMKFPTYGTIKFMLQTTNQPNKFDQMIFTKLFLVTFPWFHDSITIINYLEPLEFATCFFGS